MLRTGIRISNSRKPASQICLEVSIYTVQLLCTSLKKAGVCQGSTEQVYGWGNKYYHRDNNRIRPAPDPAKALMDKYFASIILYPEGNDHFRELVPKYKSFLAPCHENSFKGITYEEFI